MAQSGTTDLGANIGTGGGGGVTSLNSLTGALTLIPGAGITITPGSSTITIASTVSGGTVTSVSVNTANGFSGTVTNPTSTPAITLMTTVTGILFGNGTSVAAATPSNFPTLNQNTTGTASNITATTNSTITTLSSLSLPYSQVTGGPTGTVSSVGLALPASVFTVIGSPVTSSGTLTGSFNTQTANTVFAGPTTGAAVTPTFRALANADLATITTLADLSLPATQLTGTLQAAQEPAHTGDVTNTAGSLALSLVATTNSTLTTLSALSLPTSQLTGTLGIPNGGTGQTTANAAFNALAPSQTGNSGKVLSTNGTNTSWIAAGGTGTVTSVGLVDSTGLFAITGSPVTAAGNLTLSAFNSQSANTFLAAPNGSSGAPAFRTIVAADVPTLNQNTTGTAANITATSNSTLTTLSSLSLPGSQVTGNISGDASNVTGTVGFINGGTNATSLAGARTNLGIDAGASFITSGTTYTTPSGVTSNTQFKFTLVGGGGGGGGSNTTNLHSPGGGGGGTGVIFLTGLAPSTSYTIAIGAAGTGGASTPTAGGAGGNTTLTVGATTYTSAGGGGGADTTQTNGGTGGACTNTTISISGQNGGSSENAATTSASGAGGNTQYGFGGASISPAGNGLTGTGYGAGGGGASGVAGTGGAGTQGAILVEYYN